MQYSVWPTTTTRTRIPRLPLRPPDDYLRDAMVATLARQDVALDFRIQLQTDPHLMPIENAGVLWPERLSPRVSVATLHLPKQTLRLAGADRLRAPAVLQPVALRPRAPPARQPEPRPAPDVLRVVAAAPPNERRAALRAHRGRDLRVRPRHDPAVAVLRARPDRPGPRGRTAGPPRTDDRRARPRPPGRPGDAVGRLRYAFISRGCSSSTTRRWATRRSTAGRAPTTRRRWPSPARSTATSTRSSPPSPSAAAGCSPRSSAAATASRRATTWPAG